MHSFRTRPPAEIVTIDDYIKIYHLFEIIRIHDVYHHLILSLIKKQLKEDRLIAVTIKHDLIYYLINILDIAFFEQKTTKDDDLVVPLSILSGIFDNAMKHIYYGYGKEKKISLLDLNNAEFVLTNKGVHRIQTGGLVKVVNANEIVIDEANIKKIILTKKDTAIRLDDKERYLGKAINYIARNARKSSLKGNLNVLTEENAKQYLQAQATSTRISNNKKESEVPSPIPCIPATSINDNNPIEKTNLNGEVVSVACDSTPLTPQTPNEAPFVSEPTTPLEQTPYNSIESANVVNERSQIMSSEVFATIAELETNINHLINNIRSERYNGKDTELSLLGQLTLIGSLKRKLNYNESQISANPNQPRRSNENNITSESIFKKPYLHDRNIAQPSTTFFNSYSSDQWIRTALKKKIFQAVKEINLTSFSETDSVGFFIGGFVGRNIPHAETIGRYINHEFGLNLFVVVYPDLIHISGVKIAIQTLQTLAIRSSNTETPIGTIYI